MAGLLDKATTVVEDPGPWSTFIYGDYGAGKTVLGAQADGAVILDTENSRRSLLNHPELYEVPIFKIKSLSQARQFAVELPRDPNPTIKTITVDTVSSMQFYDMNSIMDGLPDNRDQDLPSEAEFNRNNRRISRFCQEIITAAKKNDRNVILLAHMKEDKDDKGQTTLIRPSTTPALTGMIAPMVDAVFYLQATANPLGEVKRVLYTIATNKVKGKNRFGGLPTKIENPHFSMIEKAADEQRQRALMALAERDTNA